MIILVGGNLPFHHWNDKSFDWNSLHKSISIGTRAMRNFGRIGVSSKEKFGSARWSIDLFRGTIHELHHPGQWRTRYPDWLWKFDVYYEPLRFLKPIIVPYQKLVVKLTFLYLANKFPHIVDEIISDAPRELLTPKLSKRAASLWQRPCKKCDKLYTCDNDSCPNCGEKH